VFQEFSGVEVGDKLTIELVPKVANPAKGQAPLLNTLEVTRLRTLHVGLAAPSSFLLSDLSRQQAGPVKLANRTDAEFQGMLRLTAPAGFSVTPGETSVRLAPNEQRTLDVTAAVATPGQPGDYFLEVSLVRPDGTVEAQRRARLEYLGPRGRLVIKATEDAYMQAGAPETNRGLEASLLVDGGNQQMGDAAYSVTYLKFPLNVPGKPISARLRLRVSPTEASESGDSGNVYRVDQPWEEYQITYANRPKPGPQVAKLGQVGRDVWEERPLDVDLAGKTELSLAIEPTTLDGATYYAREGGQAAELVVDYEPTR
jgi:hypothetical protein